MAGGPPNIGKPVIQPPSNTGAKPGGSKTGGKNVNAAIAGVPPGLQSYLGNGPLTPAALYAAAQALARAQTTVPAQELQSQINQNQQQTANAEKMTGGYFNSLGDLMNQSLTGERQIAGQTNQQLAGLGQGLQSQLGGITQNAQAALSKYTPQADLGLASPAQQGLIAEGARQRGLAAQDSGAAQRFGVIQGGNYRGLAASNLGTGAQFGQQAIANIAQAGQLRNEPLAAKQAGLRQQYGADVVDALGKLRQQEITNAITEKGLGLKAAEINATALNNQLNRQQALQVARLAQRGEWKRAMAIINGENNRAAAAQRGANQRAAATQRGENLRSAASIAARQQAAAAKASGSGGSNALTNDSQNRLFNMIDRVQALAKEPGYTQDANGNRLTPQLLWRHLQSGNNPAKYAFPRYVIAAAFDLNKYGFITPKTAQLLRQHGLRPEQHGLKIGTPGAAGGVGSGAAGAASGATQGVGAAGQGAAGGIAGVAGR